MIQQTTLIKQTTPAAMGALAASLPIWITDPIWLGTIILGMIFGITFRAGQLYSKKTDASAIKRDLITSALIAGANFSLIIFLVEFMKLSLMGTLLTAVLVAASGVQAILSAFKWAKDKFIQDQLNNGPIP